MDTGGDERVTILFKNERVREFLLDHSQVYTIRKYRRRVGRDVVREKLYGRSLGTVKVEYVGEVDLENLIVRGVKGMVWNLEDFVGESGFETVTEWVKEAKELNHIGGRKAYLYKVTLISKEV